MASEQTSYVGDDIKVLVNVIDSTGSHVSATIDTSTTRLNGFSTVPSVNPIGTGIYEIVFASVTPAPSEGDRLIAKINGTVNGTAWTEYAIPLKIVADERGLDSTQAQTNETLLRLAASAVGAVDVTDNGNGTLTLSIKDTDGTTEVRNLTYTLATGQRVQNP